ncbi:tyrosine-type recombinase/integrase [Nocardia asteroides]|uniref:tyrosine-type recombinase/integrase n=1 Tax=Nocardia asteroides TaxID=1824 RepID=UPI001E4A5876|nr:site-specific integrase [Nocardia asteroides]UGT63950.1 site-specific integrase [Nocardia asteroides]
MTTPGAARTPKSRRAEPIDTRTARNGTVTYTFQLDIGTKPDGSRIRQRFTYATKTEARREYRRISAEVAAGRFVGRTDLTVAQVAAEWLASRRDIRANTLRNYRDSLKYVTRDLGAMKVQALRQAHVDEWVSTMLEAGSMKGKPLAPATVRLALVLLQQVTEYSARQGLVPRDPAEYVQAPRQRPGKVTAADVWTKEQVHTFAAKATDDRLYAAFLLATYGLRRSEVCGLRWSDIDLTRGTLSVEQSHVEVDGSEHVVDEPKTERSRRTLPLPVDVAAALRELKTKQKRERLAAGKPWSEDAHMCAAADGEPVLPRTFTGKFHRIRFAAELPRITLRNLRHTSVSVMLHAGIPASTVAAWHGHDVRMTTTVYNRVYDEGLTAAASAMFGTDKAV